VEGLISRRLIIQVVFLSVVFGFNATVGFSETESASFQPVLDPESQSWILQKTDDIFQDVSSLSGLPIKSPVKKVFENHEFFKNYYQNLLEEEYPPVKKQAVEKAYSVLAFLTPGSDLIQTYLDSFLESVRGLYDPYTQTLYIADWIPPEDQAPILAHELTHALQDQSFQLGSYLDAERNSTTDTQFARSSLVEGQAVAIALNYSLQDKGEDFTQLGNLVDWFNLNNEIEEGRDQAFGVTSASDGVIDFPYVYGASFLQSYVKQYGWEGIDYLFKNPPNTTQQIIHPNEFFPRRKNPVEIRIEGLEKGPLKSYSRIWEDTFGEYGLFLVLKQYLGEEEAWNAVRGWRGDRLQVYEDPSRYQIVLIGYVVLDNPDSADIFFKSYRNLLHHKYHAAGFLRVDENVDWSYLNPGKNQIYLERLGKRVIFIEGTTPAETPLLRLELWNRESKNTFH
jgi:hypothetical protein